MDRLSLGSLGERLKTGGAEMGRRVSGKMKEILQPQSPEAKMVDEATSERMDEPNWGINLRICNLLVSDEFDGSEVVRAIKKRISGKSESGQRLGLDLLEACAMNCDKVFSELASEKVLDEIVRMIDNPDTSYVNRRRALQLIEEWGKSDDLVYLPVFRQTYMNLKGRKILFSIPDDGDSSFGLGFDDHAVALPERYPYSGINQQTTNADDVAYHDGALSIEEKKEILVITRNSIEILFSMLDSEEQEKLVKDDLILSLLGKCKESQPVIQSIIESIDDDELLLFEALSLHDELQQVLPRYEVEAADPPPVRPIGNDSSTPHGWGVDPVNNKEVVCLAEQRGKALNDKKQLGGEGRSARPFDSL